MNIILTRVMKFSNLARALANTFINPHQRAVDRLFNSGRLLPVQIQGNDKVMVCKNFRCSSNYHELFLSEGQISLHFGRIAQHIVDAAIDDKVVAINLGKIAKSNGSEIYFWINEDLIGTETTIDKRFKEVIDGEVKFGRHRTKDELVKSGLPFDDEKGRKNLPNRDRGRLLTTAFTVENGNVYLLVMRRRTLDEIRKQNRANDKAKKSNIPDLQSRKTPVKTGSVDKRNVTVVQPREYKADFFDLVLAGKSVEAAREKAGQVCFGTDGGNQFDGVPFHHSRVRFYGTPHEEMFYYRGGYLPRTQHPINLQNAHGETPNIDFVENEVENARTYIFTLFNEAAIESSEFIGRVAYHLQRGYKVEIDCGPWIEKEDPKNDFFSAKNNRTGLENAEVNIPQSFVAKLLPNGDSGKKAASGGIAEELRRQDDVDVRASVLIKNVPIVEGGKTLVPHLVIALQRIEKPSIKDASGSGEYQDSEKYRVDVVQNYSDMKKVDLLLPGYELTGKTLEDTVEKILNLLKQNKCISLGVSSGATAEPLGIDIIKGSNYNQVRVLLTPEGGIGNSEIYIPIISAFLGEGKQVLVNRRDPLGNAEPIDLMGIFIDKPTNRINLCINNFTDSDYDSITFPVISDFISQGVPVALSFRGDLIPSKEDIRVIQMIDFIAEHSKKEVVIADDNVRGLNKAKYILTPKVVSAKKV